MNVAYDLWAHSSSNLGFDTDPNEEIMIWLYSSGAGAIGGRQATVTLTGTSWDLHQGNTGYWNVYSFVRTSNTNSATLNIMEFLNHLVDRGVAGEFALPDQHSGRHRGLQRGWATGHRVLLLHRAVSGGCG
jgi:hypothetical protein